MGDARRRVIDDTVGLKDVHRAVEGTYKEKLLNLFGEEIPKKVNF